MVYTSLTKALVPALLIFAQNTLAQGSCAQKDDVTLTFFGLGSAGVYSKFKCSGTSVNQNSLTASVGPDAPRVQSGVGSYEDPALFATAASNTAFSRCDIIYIPYFKKYFQYGDICAQCESDWQASKLTKVDLWIGPNPTDGMTDATAKGDASCQIAGGTLPLSQIIQNPPKDLEVQSNALQGSSGQCWKSDSSLSFPGNKASCSGGGGKTSTPAPKEASSDPPKIELQKAQVVDTPVSSSSPAPSPSPAAPIVENKAAVEEKKTTMTTTTTSSSSSSSSSAAAAPTPDTQPPAKATPPVTEVKATKAETKKDAKAETKGDTKPETKEYTTPESKDTTTTTTTPQTTQPQTQNQTATTTGKPGDPCPDNGWFQGCVWGSGKGQLGETCKAKTDCWSDWICVSGKCVDNTKKLRRSLHSHGRRHLGRVHGVSV